MLKAVFFLIIGLAVILTAAYFYQVVYTAAGLLHRPRRQASGAVPLRRYAALICARNEAAVIGDLIQSLKNQNYPEELLDIFVLADNCSDNTAELARNAGAVVYTRRNNLTVGKGYALDYLFARIGEERGSSAYDGYFIFDADNLIHADFVSEMNKTFSMGYEVVTSYRNSKNFGTNWISAGYSIWFLREARFLNYPRMLFGTGCAVSGTGFLVSSRLIREQGGWPFTLLTEDIQFTVTCALSGIKIGYCDQAIVYDEQPVSFRQSWTQRSRWSKGLYQVVAKYALELAGGIFRRRGSRMVCYDMLLTIAPCFLLVVYTVLAAAFGLLFIPVLLSPSGHAAFLIAENALRLLLLSALNFYLSMFAYGLLTVVSEWRRIRATPWRKLMHLWLFPVFLATYAPLTLAALFSRPQWKPIRHTFSGVFSAVDADRGAAVASRPE
jgi:cellulose synthase/poly-beta-1,6-N-acetylglucosamine synthase-like glycosyltransferase